MINTQYCPNCSAYQLDTKAPNCHKCGHDMVAAREEQHSRKLEKVKEGDSSFDPSQPCPSCGAPTKDIPLDIEHGVRGEKIPMTGLRLMGGEIVKRATTQIFIEGVGRECREGHRIALSWTSREMPICPMCFSKLSPYGSSILSCGRCSRHFPTHCFRSRPHEEVLNEEGWEEVKG